MLRTQNLGAAAVSVPTTKKQQNPVNSARRAVSLGALVFCLRPWLAHAAPADAPYDTACTSAKAVHDARCPNYTGFKTPPASQASVASRPSTRRPAKIRVGRTLDRGVASWYGPGFQGRLTANGERFDMNELTAAHKTLPFGTHVEVESHSTGKKVMVRINDRGPFVGGRIIDLSKAAAQQLGIVNHGHDLVVLREVVNPTA